jgi:hypothetical protein
MALNPNEMPTTPKSSTKSSVKFKKQVEEDDDLLKSLVEGDDDEDQPSISSKNPTGNFKKIVTGCVVGAVVIFIVIFMTSYLNKDENPEVPSAESPPQGEGAPVVVEGGSDRPWLTGETVVAPSSPPVDANSAVANPPKIGDRITPGITDISGDTVNQNTTPISEDSFTKDLNGLDVRVDYNIAGIVSVVDFVSYTKKRSSTAEGIELYWLDAEYKGKKAKIQVPFRIFKELDPVGVTVVDVEVTQILQKDNTISEIATGFTVRSDYKQILQNSAR